MGKGNRKFRKTRNATPPLRYIYVFISRTKKLMFDIYFGPEKKWYLIFLDVKGGGLGRYSVTLFDFGVVIN